MPALEMAQDTGKLIQWLKREGEEVSKGEPLMEIETDKVTVEIEAPANGKLANVTARPGDEVPVGEVIAMIIGPGEEAPQPSGTLRGTQLAPARIEPGSTKSGDQETSPAELNASPLALRVAAQHGVDLRSVKPDGGRIEKSDVLAYVQRAASPGNGGPRLSPASPKARRLALENDLQVEDIQGSGPGGAVLAADVSAVLAAAVPEVEILPVSNVWKVMVERVTQSWTSAPHFYLMREVDASRLVAWREYAQRQTDQKITYTDLLVRVAAAGLRRHPRANASWHADQVILNSEIHIGLAVAVEEGLIVPVIHRADQLSLDQIAQQRKDLVTRAQSGKLKPEDLRNGTFTISNLGMYGVDAFNAVVNPPQAAILAVGRIAERVVPVNGQPAVRPMMVLSLSCDHRVVDGARGAQFLNTVAELIEEPLGIL
jgi:pyruvate dehydrogenase E2 component (dihydrolipoamide acetyltransferase)